MNAMAKAANAEVKKADPRARAQAPIISSLFHPPLATNVRRDSAPSSLGNHTLLQRKCACGGECESCKKEQAKKEEGTLQRKAAGSAGLYAPAVVDEVLRSSGDTLDPETRAFFEARFGQDLSQVRIHTDARAAESAHAVNALAYTVGSDIAFAAGRFAPASKEGSRLLAHELTHVIQQRGTARPAGPISIGDSESAPEHQADAFASQIENAPSTFAREAPGAHALHAQPGVTRPAAVGALQRQPAAPPAAPPPAAAAPAPPAGPVASDLQIDDVSTASDPQNIFFERNKSNLDPSQDPKIVTLAGASSADKARPLDLRAFVSEDENVVAATGTALAVARATTVDTALGAKGHTGPRNAPPPNTSASAGNSDYRSMRKVEVVDAGGPSTTTNCAVAAPAAPGRPAPPPGFIPCSNPSRFTDAQKEAKDQLTKAIDALSASPLDSATITELDARFGSTAANRPNIALQVKNNLIRDRVHILNQMTPEKASGPGHHCANDCDANCKTSVAYNVDTDDAAKMTLCDVASRTDSFMQQTDNAENGATLIHEGLHGVSLFVQPVGEGASDFAYEQQRLINFLDPKTALKNNDSYVLFIRAMNGQAVVAGRPPAQADTTSGVAMSASEKGEVDKAIAWLEGWSIWASQEMDSLYADVNLLTGQPGKKWKDTTSEKEMKEVAAQFSLTAPPVLPGKADQFALAAIDERFNRMSSVLFNVNALTFDRVAAGSTSWEAGPGTTVTIGPDFFAIPAGPGRGRAQLDLLITALVTATTGISAGAIPAYVALFDKFRVLRGGGSP